MKTVVIKPGREKFAARRHPWIFSGAVAEVEEILGIGETVDVINAHGGFLARGAYSPESQIRVRVWSWDPEEKINPDFMRARLQRAIAMRDVTSAGENALRLVHAESDHLPGLIVDRYDDTLVIQVLSAGIERWRNVLADLLSELTTAKCIYERSDAEVRVLEGLAPRKGLLVGSDLAMPLQITENDLKFQIDIAHGHKTGFYLDQRVNRARVRALARGREVLDCFSYSGGFAINALAGGAAKVTAVDSSAGALALAKENLALNGFSEQMMDCIEGDVFKVLRKLRDQARSFDMIVLDPPKFAPTAAQAQRAARGYKDINLLALKLLRPGGILVTFSCSGGVKADLFQKIVAGAAEDAQLDAQIIERLHQGPDHPVALNFPEGAYLKGLVVRVAG
jgi:23S rRNA (cytosine1962-C5)-methyltransferase